MKHVLPKKSFLQINEPVNLFWFRRDLRFQDNKGLYHAFQQGSPVLGLFIFDSNILEKLEDKDDGRVTFIHDQLKEMDNILKRLGSGLVVVYGNPEEIFPTLISSIPICGVCTNHDWDPYALDRDQKVRELLDKNNIPFHTYKDHVLFEKGEVVKSDGSPYTVFTPYARAWRATFESHASQEDEHHPLTDFPSEQWEERWCKWTPPPMLSLQDLGFERSSLAIPPKEIINQCIVDYATKRDFPALHGTSRMGVHLRFGTISVRALAKAAFEVSDVYINELIWRDFYNQIMAFFPFVTVRSFKPAYDQIEWRNNEEEFERWCLGTTGYPLVDAGMRELLATGYMHNRVRMVVASFLTKHLLIDWRWGESWFARKLLDFDLASNNGGWQWAAGSGTDAAPYFRIFNPESQQKRFDPDFQYIKEWVPEWGGGDYPEPIVEHKYARERCLKAYKQALWSEK